MNTFRFNLNTRMIAASLSTALAASTLLALSGCNAQADLNNPESVNTNRNAEAYRLSIEAQQAQRAGRNTDAITLYQRAAELQPNMPGVWNNLGVLLMERQLYLDAVTAFKREADISPEDPRPYENLGLAYSEAQHAEESIKYYELALERDPNRVESLRGLARVSRARAAADPKIADHLRRALLLETDPTWRKFFENERIRVESQLREEKESGRQK